MEANPATLPPTSASPRAGIRLPGLGVGIGRGLVVLYLSLMVLVPLVNVFVDYIRDFSLDAALVPEATRAAATPALQSEEFPLLPVADSAMRQWALLILAKEQAGAIEVEISCSSGQFSEATLQRAFDRLQSILAACVADEDAAGRAIESEALQTV